MKHTKASENNVITKESLRALEVTADLPELEGNVTVVVAKMKYTATKGQTCRSHEHPGRRCTSNNVIRVLLDSGSDGDLWFYEKGTPMHFPYLTRQVPLS
jgi:hypothetical protein